MRQLLQTSTGEVILFYMVDSTDHVTEETGLTVAVTLSKNGAAFGAAAGAVAEVGNGLYKLTPTTVDTGTLGPLVARATATGADPSVTEVNIVSNDPYVALNNAITAPTAVENREEMDINSTQLAAIVLDTAEIGTAGAGLSNINLPNQTMDITGDITGNLSGSVNSVTTAVTTDATSRTESQADVSDIPNNSEFALRTLPSADYVVTTDTIAGVTTAGSVTGSVGSVVGAVGSVTGAVGSVTGAVGSVTGDVGGDILGDVTSLTATAIDSILDEIVEGTITLRQFCKLVLSIETGKTSGGGTGTLVFRDIGDTKDRLSVTADANGNRTAVGTRDAT